MPVRAATAADLPALLRLLRNSPQAAQWSEAQLERVLQSDFVLVAEANPVQTGLAPSQDVASYVSTEADEQITGFLTARSTGSEWELDNIAVAPGFRRRSFARELLNQLITVAQSQNAEA